MFKSEGGSGQSALPPLAEVGPHRLQVSPGGPAVWPPGSEPRGGDSDAGPGEVSRLGDPEPLASRPAEGTPRGRGRASSRNWPARPGGGGGSGPPRATPVAMEVLPAGGGRIRSPEPEARPEDVAEEAVPEVPRTPSSQGTPSAGLARGSGDSWEGEEDPEDAEPGEPRGGRTSRTASLVSGLLTELYSCTEEEEAPGGGRGPGGRQRRRDSLDSSTEASGSDVVLGGRGGAGDSRVLQELQELQERPSQRRQRQYLLQKGEGGRQPAQGAPRSRPRGPLCAPGPKGHAHRHWDVSDLSLVCTVSRIHD